MYKPPISLGLKNKNILVKSLSFLGQKKKILEKSPTRLGPKIYLRKSTSKPRNKYFRKNHDEATTGKKYFKKSPTRLGLKKNIF